MKRSHFQAFSDFKESCSSSLDEEEGLDSAQLRQEETHMSMQLNKQKEKLMAFIESLGPVAKQPINLTKSGYEINTSIEVTSVDDACIVEMVNNTIRKMKNNKKMKRNWNKEDLTILLWVIQHYNETNHKNIEDYTEENWEQIAEFVPGKNSTQCMFRWLSLKKNNLNKNPWTEQEEELLRQLVEEKSKNKWIEISQALYIGNKDEFKTYRSPKQCREHWTCYMDPSLKKGPWMPAEDILLLKQYSKLGKKWSEISKKISGRTENAVKNRFNLLMIKQEKLFGKKKMNEQQYIKFLENEAASNQREPIQTLTEKQRARRSFKQEASDSSDVNSLKLDPEGSSFAITKGAKGSATITHLPPPDKLRMNKKTKSTVALSQKSIHLTQQKYTKKVSLPIRKKESLQEPIPRKIKRKSIKNSQINMNLNESQEISSSLKPRSSSSSVQTPFIELNETQLPIYFKSIQQAQALYPEHQVQKTTLKVVKFRSIPLEELHKLGRIVPATFSRKSMELCFDEQQMADLKNNRVPSSNPPEIDISEFLMFSQNSSPADRRTSGQSDSPFIREPSGGHYLKQNNSQGLDLRALVDSIQSQKSKKDTRI